MFRYCTVPISNSSGMYDMNRFSHSALTDQAILDITQTRGVAAQTWLMGLPTILLSCEQHWNLEIEKPFPNLSYNFVATAKRADGTKVVLKIGMADDVEFRNEAEALLLFDGRSAVRLLEYNPELGAMLLEKVEPGTPLHSLQNDEQSTVVAAEVMKKLWRPAPSHNAFPSTTDWANGLQRLRQRFNGGTGPLPKSLVEESERIFSQLHASQAEAVLLHGDLHYDNILSARRESWLAIDPKGVIGEPAYEVGALLRNPLPKLLNVPDPKDILSRRLDLFSQSLEIDRERLRSWGIAQAVLSAWWSIEGDEGNWQPAIKCAELLAALT